MIPGVIAAAGGGEVGGEAKPGLVGLNSDYDDFVNITPVAGWGTMRRSTAYTGPAIRVEDAGNPGTATDVNFDADGRLTGAAPYGSDTRVITIYDQFGSEDLTALYTDGITVETTTGGAVGYDTWRIRFPGSSVGMYAPTSTGSGAAWELDYMVWALGYVRTADHADLRIVWGVPGTGFMRIGVWEEGADLHWRVNGSPQDDWDNTDWTLDAATVQNKVSRIIADCSDDVSDDSFGYMNNTLRDTRANTLPITYDTGNDLGVGDWGGLGNAMTNDFIELTIFDPDGGPMTSDNRGWLDEALEESVAVIAEQNVSEFQLYVVEGPPEDVVFASELEIYVVEG